MEININNVIRLPVEDSGLALSIVRVANCNIGDKSVQFKRRTPLIIKCKNSNKWVIRYVMGNSGLKKLNKNSIALDYDGVNELGIKYNTHTELTISRANIFQCMRWLYQSPDLNIRFSFRLGLLGSLLGLVGLLISFI